MQTQEFAVSQQLVLTDGILVQKTLQGQEWAFEQLVQRYSGSLFGFIYHFLGDNDQACDILQQVLLQLYLSLPTLRTNDPLRAWLFQVARNRCLDLIRQRQRRQTTYFSELEAFNEEEDISIIGTLPDTGPLPEDLAERHDLQQQLGRAIQALPPKFRAVVLLRYTAQLSFSEIAQTLNMPTATVKTYFQRAKPLLKSSLSDIVR